MLSYSNNHSLGGLQLTSVLCSSVNNGSNEENCFHENSYSELGSQAYLGTGSQTNLSRYKTKLCWSFEENGICRYNNCQYAHGVPELRSLNHHPKYKTKLCCNFHRNGFCHYGLRCNFIHYAEERCRLPPFSAFSEMGNLGSFSFTGFPCCTSWHDSIFSVTSPPTFSTDALKAWQSSPLSFSSQELSCLFTHSLAPQPMSVPTSESPTNLAASLTDHEGYLGSVGSHSGSESHHLDSIRPIFRKLSADFSEDCE